MYSKSKASSMCRNGHQYNLEVYLRNLILPDTLAPLGIWDHIGDLEAPRLRPVTLALTCSVWRFR